MKKTLLLVPLVGAGFAFWQADALHSRNALEFEPPSVPTLRSGSQPVALEKRPSLRFSEHRAGSSASQRARAQDQASAAEASLAIQRWWDSVDRGTEDAFAAEPVDEHWEARRQLMEKLPAALPQGSTIMDLDCRTTLCRVETKHVDAARYAQFTQQFDIKPGQRAEDALWGGSSRFVSAPDDIDEEAQESDQVIGVAFLARPGSELPSGEEFPREIVAVSNSPSGETTGGTATR
jgi:hypothetical protein